LKLVKIIGWVGLLAMTLALAQGFILGDFFADGSELLSNPWGIVSLVDLYVGFVLFSCWIAFREKKNLSHYFMDCINDDSRIFCRKRLRSHKFARQQGRLVKILFRRKERRCLELKYLITIMPLVAIGELNDKRHYCDDIIGMSCPRRAKQLDHGGRQTYQMP